MKKTKVILFILLFALVIGVSTQVKAEVYVDEYGEIVFYGNTVEFMQLSKEEKESIQEVNIHIDCINCSDTLIENKIFLKDLHLEEMKSLQLLYISNQGCEKHDWCRKLNLIDFEGCKELPNVKKFYCVDYEEKNKEGWGYFIEKIINVEELQITFGSPFTKGESEYEVDYSKLKELKNLKYLMINDINMIDINKLPKLENLTFLKLSYSYIDQIRQIKNFKEISNKFKKIDTIRIYGSDKENDSATEILFDDLIYIIDNCKEIDSIDLYDTIIIKDYGNVTKDKILELKIPSVVLLETIAEEKNCKYKPNDNSTDYSNYNAIILDTSKVGENEAIIKDSDGIEIKIKYNVVEPEKPVEPEQPTEPQEPEQPVVEPEQPTEPTGGVMSKLLDTIRNLIKSIIDKIMGLFKFKV